MALVFGDSFDHYPAADILKKWTTNFGMEACEILPEYAMPPHGVALLVGSTTGSYLGKTLSTPLTTFVVGFWFRTGSLAAASLICAAMDTATTSNIHVSVRYNTSGNITFCRDATVLATSANAIATNTWYHFEVKVTIGDAADSPSGRYEVRVNGSATGWIADSGTGQDTRNSGNAQTGNIRIYSRATTDATTSNHRWQDFYILDTTGSVANNFLGPCRFSVMRPIAAGQTAEWTGNYADNWVNAGDMLHDGDTTFNQSSSAGQTDQFTMTDVPAGTVHAIQHVLVARKDAGGARVVRPITRISASDYNGTSFNMGTTYVMYCDPVSISPASSAQWTDTEVQALEGGYELVS